MTTQYQSDIDRAAADIKAAGVLVNWSRAVADDSNDTPWYTAEGVPITYPVYIVFFPSNRQNLWTMRVGKEEQATGTVQAMIAGNVPFVPTLDDTIIMPDSSTLRLTGYNTTNPDGTAIIYELSFDR